VSAYNYFIVYREMVYFVRPGRGSVRQRLAMHSHISDAGPLGLAARQPASVHSLAADRR
jgi:hypothetical protein